MRAAGYETRFISDWTDHVWTEYWSDALGRWVHADSCEASRHAHCSLDMHLWLEFLACLLAIEHVIFMIAVHFCSTFDECTQTGTILSYTRRVGIRD